MESVAPGIIFFWIATAFYGIAATIQIMAFLQKKEKLGQLAMKFVWLGLFAHTLNFFWPALRQNYTGI